MDITTVADAVSVLEFLYRRDLVCQVCANEVSVVRHAASGKTCCAGCRNPHARYEDVIVSRLEKHVISALKRWNAANPSDA